MRNREAILEELWVLRAQDGDRRALGRLAERIHPRMVRLATRLVGYSEAADVAQEAWLAVLRGLSRLEDPARFRAWALRITAHKARDRIRHLGRRRRLDREVAAEAGNDPARTATPPPEPEPAASPEAGLERALAGLSPEHRAVLDLHYLEALPVAEMATILGIPEGTVKSRLFHARRKLRREIETPSTRAGDPRSKQTGGP